MTGTCGPSRGPGELKWVWLAWSPTGWCLEEHTDSVPQSGGTERGSTPQLERKGLLRSGLLFRQDLAVGSVGVDS